MQVQVNLYEDGTWKKELDNSLDSSNTLITAFSNKIFKKNEAGFKELYEKFPNSVIIGCSTTGEIYEDELHDGSLSVAIAKFEKTNIVFQHAKVNQIEDSFNEGSNLAKKFDQNGLKSLFILGDGLGINGSDLVQGFNNVLDRNIIVTGGMASDDGEFKKTWVFVNNKPCSNHVTAVGFYGEHIKVDYASEGGWSQFGLERLVTSCDTKTSTIYTLDNKPVLELYKNYMGEHAKHLPNSALEFPFLMIEPDGDSKIRAIWEANEENQSIKLFGDIKEGNKIIFLKGSTSYLITGAQQAAQNLNYPSNTPVLSLTVSCMGRRAVLKDRTEDEIEIVKETFSDNVSQVGFYSYGELSPRISGKSGLLNQTMTLTVIWES
ncbi:FIST C-terminal domain-containing protein [bacterium]|nr:FIST C-terminal domain-containing protein [bacterium]MBU1959363.1 FIST C-terminal domain-containing protein [bacterium]